MYLLDTNTLIHFFKGRGNVAKHLLRTPPKDISIPSIVYYELQAGIRKSLSPEKRIEQLNEVARSLNIITFGTEEAVYAAAIRSDLERQGNLI